MPATMTRAALRSTIRHNIGEPQGIEKSWQDLQINEYIQDAMNRVASFGIIQGYIDQTVGDGEGEVDAGTDFDIPPEMLQLRLIIVGDTEYRLRHAGDALFVDDEPDSVIVNETEDTVTFPEEVIDGAEIRWVGVLWSTQLDATDIADDSTAINIDDRFKDLVVADACMRCFRPTEDNYTRFKELWDEEVARFGLAATLAKKIQYVRAFKMFNERCPY